MRNKFIKFNKPYLGREEERMALFAIKKGDLSADGYFGQKLSRTLSSYLNISNVYLTSSCSSALELAVRSLEIGKGDEVIIPSFTMPSTANAVISTGAKVIFSEIERDSLSLDPLLLERIVTKRTKAIIVWYGGFVCQIEKITAIARKYKLAVIEDAACALGTKVGNRFAGTFGDLGCFSFHSTKNIVCGEGGALVTNRKDLCSKIEILRNHGTNRAEVLLGKASSYQWISLGGSYLLSDVLAAIALAQLLKIKKINKKRREIAHYYLNCFKKINKKVWFPFSQREKGTNWQTFAFCVSKEYQLLVISELKKRRIEASFHYLPLHNSPFGKKLMISELFPVTEDISSSIIRLPIYPSLKKEEQRYITKSLIDILSNFSLL